jgi:fumarate hydratase class II
MNSDGGRDPETRVEHDSMGEVPVPARAKWRARTQRAVQNSPISGAGLSRAHIAALAGVKAAAASANGELGALPADLAEAIGAAARTYAESSPSVVTPLNRYVGYEEAAKIAKQALAEGRTLREVAFARGHVAAGTLTAEQLDVAPDVLGRARPGTHR